MAGSSHDSFDSKNIPMYPFLVPEEGTFDWDETDCDEWQFHKDSDSPSEYFHTDKQFKMYRGGLDKRPMYKKHRQVVWDYLENFPQLRSVVHALDAMGLKHMIQLRQDWDHNVIRQFYATLEVRMKQEKLTWMTGTSVLKASFSDLARACHVDYQAMKQGKDVFDLDELGDNEKHILFYHADNGAPTGLRRTPRVIWKILRRTIMPEHDDDETDPYDIEMIMAVMKEERLNIVKWMVDLMQANRQDKDSPLIFQPYIMALVLLKLPTLHTAMYEEHRQYRVNNLDREVLLREPSPFAYVPPTIPEGPGPMAVEGHPVVDISSDTAHSVASGHDSSSTAHTCSSYYHVQGP